MASTTINASTTSISFGHTPKRIKTTTHTCSYSTSSGTIQQIVSSTSSDYSYSNWASVNYATFTISSSIISQLISVKVYAKTDSTFNSNYDALYINGTKVGSANSTSYSMSIPISQVSTSTQIPIRVEAKKTFSGSDTTTVGTTYDHTGLYYSDVYLKNQVSSGGTYEKVYRTDSAWQTGTQRTCTISNIQMVIEYGSGGSQGGTDAGTSGVGGGGGIFIGVDGKARKVQDLFIGVDGKARKIAEVFIGVDGKARRIYPALTLGNLNPGSIVLLPEDSGSTKQWIVVHQDYYKEGQTILLRKDCINVQKPLSSNTITKYQSPYLNCDADAYLSKTWVAARTATFKNLLTEAPITCKSWDYSSTTGGIFTENRKIWLPSAANLSKTDWTNTYDDDDSTGLFDYFALSDVNSRRIAYNDGTSTAVKWWARSVISGTHPNCKAISTSGSGTNQSYTSYAYLRPVIGISSSTIVEESNGTYKLV